MQDYKAGDMIGSTPRLLTWSQLFAVPIGAAAVAWMYPLLAHTYGIVGEDLRLLVFLRIALQNGAAGRIGMSRGIVGVDTDRLASGLGGIGVLQVGGVLVA